MEKEKKGREGVMRGLKQQLLYAGHVLFHPFDGFYDLKHEKRGSLKAALVLYGLYWLTEVLKQQLTGYIFNGSDPADFNVLTASAVILVPLVMWCAANWCVTSLMDGEGSFPDMLTATGYALVPAILLNPLAILLSNLLGQNEAMLLGIVTTITTIWMGGLLFFGMLVTQQYSLGKALLTTLLTFLGMALMAYIFLLVLYLLQQVYGFGRDLYMEIAFRFRR